MPIEDMARTDVVAVAPDASARAIARTMDERNVGSAVVVEDERPIGIVTDRDLAVRVVRENADAATLTAAELMTKDPFTASRDAGIYDVLSEMCAAGVRRVPLVADDGTIAGIVTLDDFVVLLASELGNVSGVIQEESPSY